MILKVKILAVEEKEFIGQGGDQIKGYTLICQDKDNRGYEIWSKESLDETIDYQELEVKVGIRRDGKLKYTLV